MITYTIIRGTDKILNVTFKDQDNTILNLTDSTSINLAVSDKGTTYLSKAMTVSSPPGTDGNVTLQFVPSDTSLMDIGCFTGQITLNFTGGVVRKTDPFVFEIL